MTPLDFYLWGYLRSSVYETPIQSEQDLIGRIIEASAWISETKSNFLFYNLREQKTASYLQNVITRI